ncbi:HEPN family nuclease [Aeromonas veronii]|uniref:HEPN family nuclease n=1 Tax=Aeromonas veronii TaxID=654 RepID=UPI0038EBDDAF
MGNYVNFEQDFVTRTIQLIEQYYGFIENEPFERQFNYTLILNCLLGVIVMPKERAINSIPNTRLTMDFKQQMGVVHSILPDAGTTLRQLIIKMRHSIAHFDIDVESINEHNFINFVNFKDTETGQVYARFLAEEIFPFLRFYAQLLVESMRNQQRHRELA